jgi:hypothetical protein
MSMLNNLIKMIMADPAAVAELQAMNAAPTVTRKPAKGKGKRTLTDEQKAKMAAGRKAASAARAAATGKPAPEPVVEAAKPAKVKGKGKAKFGKAEAGTGQRDRKGRVWVPLWIDGEFAGSVRQDVARAMFIAIRGEQAGALLTHIESQG